MSDPYERRRQIDELFRAAMSGRLSRRELLWRAAALGLAAPLVQALAWAAPVKAASAAPGWPSAGRRPGGRPPASEQVVRLPQGPIVTLDPGVSNGGTGLEIMQNIFEGLVGVDVRTNQVNLLQAARMVASDDASDYTFTLRDDIKFSDGQPITAYDYEWSWRRVLLPETKSDYTEAMYPIKGALEFAKGQLTAIEEVGIRALDAHTIRVSLVGPTPYFPLLAATWTFTAVPRHVVERHGEAWTDGANIVSSGPFMLKEWKYDQSIQLLQNPHYWGPRPALTRADFVLFPDPVAQALIAFENDEIDQAEVFASDLDRVRNDPRLSRLLGEYPRSATQFIALDTTNPPLNDVRFRQALSMSISRNTLANQILKGMFTPTQTILSPDIPGYNAEAALGENVDQARALLAQVGSGFRDLTLAFRPYAVDKSASEYLQEAWRRNLGLNVRLDPMEPKAFAEWRRARRTNPYDMYFTWWGSDYGDPANWHNFAWVSDADFYITHWKNDEFDRLATQARGNTNEEQRVQMYRDAERILVRDVPAIPLYNLKRFYVIAAHLKGVYHGPVLDLTWLKYISVEDH